mgnify:CR=1 FL=1
MKKFLSFIFWLIIIVGACTAGYYYRDYLKIQCNKVQGMYYVYQGDEAYKKLQLSKAIKFYNNGLKLYPGHYSAWYNLGNIYVAYEDYYSALHAYSQAFKYNPKMMTARMNYGIISTEKLGNFDAALEQYNKIIETDRRLLSIPYIYDNRKSTKENKAIAYYNSGVTYRMKSIYSNNSWEHEREYLSKAISSYKNSIDINPNSYDAQYNLGLAYHIAGDYSNAGKYYCNAIKLSPTSYEAHYNLAVLLRRLKHYNEALEEIDKASTLISAIDNNAVLQEYASIIMTDIMKNVYQNEEYTKSLKNSLEKEKEKNKKQIEKSGVKLTNGRISLNEKPDKKVIDSFGKCPNLSLFNDEDY